MTLEAVSAAAPARPAATMASASAIPHAAHRGALFPLVAIFALFLLPRVRPAACPSVPDSLHKATRQLASFALFAPHNARCPILGYSHHNTVRK